MQHTSFLQQQPYGQQASGLEDPYAQDVTQQLVVTAASSSEDVISQLRGMNLGDDWWMYQFKVSAVCCPRRGPSGSTHLLLSQVSNCGFFLQLPPLHLISIPMHLIAVAASPQVVPCAKIQSHKWTLCPCAHAGKDVSMSRRCRRSLPPRELLPPTAEL